MPVVIENRTNRLVLLRLNSGQTLHLAPYKTSVELRDVEVKSNGKVQKLQNQRIIALHPVEEKKPPLTGAKKKKADSTEDEK